VAVVVVVAAAALKVVAAAKAEVPLGAVEVKAMGEAGLAEPAILLVVAEVMLPLVVAARVNCS